MEDLHIELYQWILQRGFKIRDIGPHEITGVNNDFSSGKDLLEFINKFGTRN